jgi:hypothetical protein
MVLVSVLIMAVAVIDLIVGIINVVILYDDCRRHIDSGLRRRLNVTCASGQCPQKRNTCDETTHISFEKKSFVIHGLRIVLACEQVLWGITLPTANIADRLLHCCQQFVQGNGGKAGGGITHRIRDNELASMQQCAAGINDIWHIAFTFCFIGTE